MRLYDALKNGESYLIECGIEDASTDAWLLLEYVTGMSRTTFLLERQSEMEESALKKYRQLINERGKHIPLQHITGEQDFMGLRFQVNEHVLIPRQDTEILVEEALTRLQADMHVLDMCTGSGCIAVSIAKLAKTSVSVDAADISKEALKVASGNNMLHDANVHLIESDLFDHIERKYDMIVSNPPYIRTAVIRELSEEVRLHEPYQALDGKEDGLYFYREIIRKSVDYLNKGGWLLFEIGYDQGAEVQQLMRENGYEQIRLIRDLAGLDRVVLGRKEND